MLGLPGSLKTARDSRVPGSINSIRNPAINVQSASNTNAVFKIWAMLYVNFAAHRLKMSHFTNFPEIFFNEDFQDQARHASDNRECIRLLGLRLLQKGLSETCVANLLDVHPQAVYKWLYRYKKGGVESIKDQGGRGRKNTLTNEQEQEFKNAVLNLQEQREGGRVVGRDIKKMLKDDFGIECANSTVYKLLHKVGLSWISGRTRHPESDPEEHKTFKKTSKNRCSKGFQTV